MGIVILVIIISYLIAFILSLIVIPLGKRYEQKLKKIKTKNYKDIYVLLPALKEQKIVNETIEWFHKVKYKGQIKFVIITSEKEDEYYRKNNIKEITTRDLVDKKISKMRDNRFIHLHYPKTNGNKSSQMNFALDEIQKNVANVENTYISAEIFPK